jgi:hypothetical protein
MLPDASLVLNDDVDALELVLATLKCSKVFNRAVTKLSKSSDCPLLGREILAV